MPFIEDDPMNSGQIIAQLPGLIAQLESIQVAESGVALTAQLLRNYGSISNPGPHPCHSFFTPVQLYLLKGFYAVAMMDSKRRLLQDMSNTLNSNRATFQEYQYYESAIQVYFKVFDDNATVAIQWLMDPRNASSSDPPAHLRFLMDAIIEEIEEEYLGEPLLEHFESERTLLGGYARILRAKRNTEMRARQMEDLPEARRPRRPRAPPGTPQ